MSDQSNPTPAATAPAAWPVWLAETRQIGELWGCAWSAYFDWLSEMGRAAGPDRFYAATARLMARDLDLASQAAAVQQAAHGTVTPTLNEP